LVVEVKGDSASRDGSLWVATNQCLGGASACVNLTESYNDQLKQCQSDLINGAVFSIAISGTEGRLFISWKDNGGYYTQVVKYFALQDLEHFLAFRSCALNIIDWGKGERLKEIQDSLDSFAEKSSTISKAALGGSISVSSSRKRKAPDDE
jgi:hypothetical protein